jgi:hypothetical protein
VEVLRRYSNRRDLLKPLVSVLERIEAGDCEDVPGVQSHGPLEPWRVNDRLSAAELQELVNQLQAGVSRPKLAQRYGISLSSVKRLLRKQRQ